MVGREKVYTSLEHVAVTLQTADLQRLDAIPGDSRNQRICKLLDVYDWASRLTDEYRDLPLTDVLAGCEHPATAKIMAEVELLFAEFVT
jgi:hypothetical protein